MAEKDEIKKAVVGFNFMKELSLQKIKNAQTLPSF